MKALAKKSLAQDEKLADKLSVWGEEQAAPPTRDQVEDAV